MVRFPTTLLGLCLAFIIVGAPVDTAAELVCTYPMGWSRIQLSNDARVLSLASSPEKPRTMFLGVWGGLFRTDDCATTLTQLPVPSDLEGGKAERRTVEMVAAGRDDVVYVGGGLEGPYMSYDGGATWLRMNATATTSIVASIDLSGRAYGTFFPQFTQGMYGLFRSDDAGKTWMPVVSGYAGKLVGAEFDAEDTVYSVYQDQLLRFDGRVRTFAERVTIASFAGKITAASVLPGQRMVWAAVKDGGLYWSADSGAQWQVVGLPTGDSDVVQLVQYAHDEGTVFAVTSDGRLWVYSQQ